MHIGSGAAHGVICMVGGCALLMVNDAAMKWISGDYPVAQSVFLRGVLLCAFLLVLCARESRKARLRILRPDLQLLRGAISVVSVFMFITALGLLPLVDAIALTFASPLIVTALSPLLLGEPVGWRRRLAVLVGFMGVLLMLRPGEAGLQLAVLLPLGVAAGEAARDILARKMVHSESTVVTITFTNVMVTAVALVVALPDWRALKPEGMLAFAVAAVFMGLAQLLIMEAFRHGEAALVAPFRYSAVIWAALIGIAVFGHWPDAWVVAGCTVVVASGLYILHREVVTARAGRHR